MKVSARIAYLGISLAVAEWLPPSWRIRCLLVVTAVGLSTLATSCIGDVTYVSPAADLHVVDQEGAPVSDALILVTWKLGGSHDVTVRFLHIVEGRTDADGRLTIPAWGPEIALDGALASDQPHLRVFKRGYLGVFDTNAQIVAGSRTRPIVYLKWINSPIVLVKAVETTDEYKKAIRILASTLLFYAPDKQCLVREAHEMLDAVRIEISRVDPTYPIALVPNRTGCTATPIAP